VHDYLLEGGVRDIIIDPSADSHGLPSCLRIPIAAADVESIKTYVGTILRLLTGRNRRINAILVKTDRDFRKTPGVKLWHVPQALTYKERLYPEHQVWVHVDYDNYRKGYIALGMPPIQDGYFLDHVQNREAIRLRNYGHPYLRLCPVSRSVNTNAGSNHGGEGMEKEYLKNLPNMSPEIQAIAGESMSSKIVYADPMDLTKMLDISPGTGPLSGVRDTQYLFYPG